MAKNPQKAGGKGELDRVGEKSTGGWNGPVKPKEDFKPKVVEPKPADHGESAVPK